MISLLDVNFLIALVDAGHFHHAYAHDWFDAHCADGWATCPITENGLIRIVGQPSFARNPLRPAQVSSVFRTLVEQPGHRFWPDEISLLTSPLVDLDSIPGSRHLTDTYLLALAVYRGGQFVTFDRKLVTDAVKGGRAALHVIEP